RLHLPTTKFGGMWQRGYCALAVDCGRKPRGGTARHLVRCRWLCQNDVVLLSEGPVGAATAPGGSLEGERDRARDARPSHPQVRGHLSQYARVYLVDGHT